MACTGNSRVQRCATAATFVDTILLELVVLASASWLSTLLAQDVVLQGAIGGSGDGQGIGYSHCAVHVDTAMC